MTIEAAAPAVPWQQARAENLRRYLAVMLVGVTGNASAIIKPILIGTYVAHFAFSPRTAGYLLAAEMTAAAIGTLTSAVFLAHWSQRRFVVAGILMILFGNVAASVFASVPALFLARIVAGFGHGFTLGPVGAAIARVDQPDRLSGLMSILVMASASMLSFAIPQLQASIGGRGLFVAMAATIPLAVAVLKWFPERAESKPGVAAALPPMPSWQLTLLATVGLFTWYLVVGGYWPYVEQFARAAGLDYAAATRVLGWATLLSVCGASLSVVVGNRFGRVRMLALLFLAQLASVLTLLFIGTSFIAYATAASLFVFAWIALFPYLLGLMSQIDPGGRLNGILYTTALMGYAIGPAAAGYLTGQAASVSEGLANVQRVTLVLLLLSAAMLMYLAAIHGKKGIARDQQRRA